MATIRAVFFDLDDTLCDAKPAFAEAAETAFDLLNERHPHLGRDTIRERWRAIHGPLMADLAANRLPMAEVRLRRFRHLLADLGVPDDPWADELDHALGARQLSQLPLFDDTAVLDDLRERGLHVGIITNGAGDAHPDSQRSKAVHLGLLERVDSFWVSDDIGHRKPDARAFLPALDAAGVLPEEALYVGDSPENDIAGANAAGLVSVLLQRSPSTAPRILAPRHIISSLVEVIPLFTPPSRPTILSSIDPARARSAPTRDD